MMKPTQEFVVGALLLATLAIILANHFVERTVTFDHQTVSHFLSTDDRNVGGDSKSSAELEDGIFKFEYDVDPISYPNPYTVLQIHNMDQNDENVYMDLSWVNFFEIELRSSKPNGEYFLFATRNFDPTITKPGDFTSYKYNESLIHAPNEMSVVKIKRDEFLVPSWWKKQYNVRGEDAYPSFKNTKWCEFTTQGDIGFGELEIKSIKCSGHWINTATLNQALLWLWMGGTLIASLHRMFRLNQKLDEKTASATALLKRNNLLISESATYHELARRDPLTGLLNRYGLEGEFEKLTSASEDLSYTIVLFDVDDFKTINDQHGHCYGDRVLFDVARIAKSKIGESDIFARWGGDEFLIILVNQDVYDAKDLAEEIREAIHVSEMRYTCSFGVCESLAKVPFNETFRNADTALYESKNGGRNTTNVFRHRIDDVTVDSDETGDDQVPVVLLPTVEQPQVGFTIFD